MDWNEDGLNDLIVGENNGKVRYFRNIGTAGNPSLTFAGYVQDRGTDIDIGDYSTPWIDDWNEDGLKDLLVGESDGVINLFLNVGTNSNPVFDGSVLLTVGGSNLDVGYRSAPNVVDMNGDGVKDVVSGEMGGKVYYYQNNGTNASPVLAAGAYVAVGGSDLITPGTARSAPIDWDQDGEMDLIVGSYDALLRLFIQEDMTDPKPQLSLLNLGSIVLPGGGDVNYRIALTHSGTSTEVVDVWTELLRPDGSILPMISRPDFSITPGASITRELMFSIPSIAQNGIYYYNGYTGNQETGQIYSSPSFYIYKTADDGGSSSTGWFWTDWEEDPIGKTALAVPETINLSATPNPFNPVTNLSYNLPEAGLISITVFNAAGQEVAELVNGHRLEGVHSVSWDASAQPSGMYFIKLSTQSQSEVQKVLLLK